jgi:hypothetical protein
MVPIQDLIRKNNRDIALFRRYIAKLTGKPGNRKLISDLKRRIAVAEESNATLRATR